jgi:hypothetical protein
MENEKIQEASENISLILTNQRNKERYKNFIPVVKYKVKLGAKGYLKNADIFPLSLNFIEKFILNRLKKRFLSDKMKILGLEYNIFMMLIRRDNLRKSKLIEMKGGLKK